MARPKTDAREQIVSQLTDLFFEFGYDGTTLALISERTSLGRASLYHHFPGGKDEMARAVLDRCDAWSEANLDSLLEANDPPRERLAKYLRAVDEVQYRAHQLTPANAFGIGGGLPRFGDSLSRRLRKNLLMRLLIDCGIEPGRAERRAWEAKILIEGALVCCRVLDDLSLYRSVMQSLPERLLAADENLAFLSDVSEAGASNSRSG